MNNKITNPFLKQLISGISQKATQGRITDIGWNILEEAKKNKKVVKKSLKKEGEEKSSQQPEDRFEWENDSYHSRQFEKSDVSWREYDKKMNPESYRVKEADKKEEPAADAGDDGEAIQWHHQIAQRSVVGKGKRSDHGCQRLVVSALSCITSRGLPAADRGGQGMPGA
jgi:hypothetical protein